ncbi:MAG: diaminopimelate decarboxylase [Pseudomonadales bacterium]|nr:diaminopimelate decarboxylase [Pseudomonadales bacterium]
MDAFQYRDDQLFVEDMPLAAIAGQFGTPCYVYSRAMLETAFKAYQTALGNRPHLLCYAVKANSNIAVLNVLARLGAGFDIVSEGELERVLAAGGDPARTIFSGVGKSAREMARALQAGIRCFNVESHAELLKLDEVACSLGRRAAISLRVNPDVDANTHPYISTGLKDNKFGIALADAADIYALAASLKGIRIVGLDCHIGSQLTSLAPFLDALGRLLALIDRLSAQGIDIEHLDLGGGLGVRYEQENPPSPGQYIAAIVAGLGTRKLPLIFEPGRSICANAGVLLTTVEYLKCGEDKNFAIVDAAMNDLIRPALYQAWMDIVPVRRPAEAFFASNKRDYDVVGPVCESADFLGKNRRLALNAGDLLAVRSAGAYGFTMSSNYNTRNRAAEIMVDGDQAHLIRRRETYDDQLQLEHLLPATT